METGATELPRRERFRAVTEPTRHRIRRTLLQKTLYRMRHAALHVSPDLYAKEIEHADLRVDGVPDHGKGEERHADALRPFPPAPDRVVEGGEGGVYAVELDEPDSAVGLFQRRELVHVSVDLGPEDLGAVVAAPVVGGYEFEFLFHGRYFVPYGRAARFRYMEKEDESAVFEGEMGRGGFGIRSFFYRFRCFRR